MFNVIFVKLTRTLGCWISVCFVPIGLFLSLGSGLSTSHVLILFIFSCSIISLLFLYFILYYLVTFEEGCETFWSFLFHYAE